jgi:hypothetical protein
MTVSASGLDVSTGNELFAVDPGHPTLSGDRWLMLWTVDLLGECTCPGGSSRRTGEHGEAIGSAQDCGTGPGKHPWAVRERGREWTGFRRGATDALPMDEVVTKYGQPGARRRWGMTLSDVMVIDIDSELAAQTFYRIRHHVHIEKMLGIAQTPRGWHVYLHAPGWTQKAVNGAMRSWLRDWHGTDRSKVTVKGMVLDVRTGAHRYTVWPGEGARDRRWVTVAEFRDAINAAGRGMPKDRLITDGTRAPWNREMTPELAQKISEFGQDNYFTQHLRFDGSRSDKLAAWYQLADWCGRLAKMSPESGRNNRLNATAYHAGAAAIHAGVPLDAVRRELLTAAAACSCPGAEPTIESGLRSGLARLGHGR